METASVSRRGHRVLKKALNPVFEGGSTWLRRCLYRCAGANHLFFAGVAPTYWSHSLIMGRSFFMRKGYLLLAGAGAVLLAACSSDKNGNQRRYQEGSGACLSNDGITLASSGNAGYAGRSPRSSGRLHPAANRLPRLASGVIARPPSLRRRSFGQKRPRRMRKRPRCSRLPWPRAIRALFQRVRSRSRFPIRAARRLVVTMDA